MLDIQNTPDQRGIEIQQVGVKDVHLPVLIATQSGSFQQVLGRITLSAGLPQSFKGTHMSRFMEVLVEWGEKPISGRELKMMLTEIRTRLSAPSAQISLIFRYFLPQQAPVSRIVSPLDYQCEFAGCSSETGYDYRMGVEIPVLSLCPCSKAIAKYGAHNQRAMIRVWIRCHPGRYLWIEELVGLLQNQGSSCVYPLVKREDEKHITEEAYENPKFVEDILRDCVLSLRAEKRITWFRLEVESYESIHNHSAFARHEEWTTAEQPHTKG
ncbi:MAG TPA: GTP cyclohydrolase FolE2 [Bacillota bacterium]